MVETTALLAYDTLLTFQDEVEYIWRRRIGLGTVLYVLARYAALIVFAMGAVYDRVTLDIRVGLSYIS